MNQYEAFEALERIRKEGTVNMWGAAPVLSELEDISLQEAREHLVKWIDSHMDKKDGK